ncbi:MULTISPECIES: ABC transporter permease [Halococcus]|uniref:Binding-protein-dependent transporters inner membrane component n=1 Tax=Halococcus salifodinae DSM 8989 TaxID=1227456 RepID=M0MX05_9EURY|nr:MULTISPECIES: ABC transporter permease [Halococcus]EMA50106.1 binding-protein-dependent transporters inner membrane component [Halococcus salifodinae DSM 8989]
MATDEPSQRFDSVDWNDVAGGSSRAFSANFKGVAAVLGAIFALILYDLFVVPGDTPTFAAIGWNYDVTGLDWLFAISIVLFGFYGVLPLYQNARMTRYYWQQFRKNRPAVLSLVFLAAVFVGGLLGPLFISAPEVQLFTKYQPPVGFEISRQYVINCAGPIVDGACQGTWQYPLGTTQNGRDIFKMIVYGMQITMKIAFIATLMVLTIGTAVGTTAAYMGGLVDEVLMRYVDIQQSFPTFILYLLILYIFGGSLTLFILLFGLFAWEGTARYVRSNALAKSQEEYIKAVQLSGASTYQVIRRHIIPNTASSWITDLTLLIPGFLLFEAQLAFLGLGDSTVPSWGQLIAAGRGDLSFAPWITLMPGFVLFFTILAFNFLGDAVLDAIDPETQAEAER